MKNPLELELQLKIKRANRFLTAKQYPEAINQYTEGLALYHENRTFNDVVSEQFQAIFYSLRGNAYSLNFNSQPAEEDFEKSLKINPYSALTLSRRARHFMKQKLFSEAIQDIDMALLYDPENLSYLSLLNSIQNYVNEMKDEEEKNHLLSLVSDVKNRLQAKPETESQSDEEDDEQILNFSKLRQIDRKSVRGGSSLRKSAIQFKQDEILEYVKEDQKKDEEKEEELNNIKISSIDIEEKLKQQDLQLQRLEAEEQEIRKTEPIKLTQHFILTKTHEKSRKSILRTSSMGFKGTDKMLFISSPGEKHGLLRKSSISVASIKDIDGKLIKHQEQKIRFRPSLSQVGKFDIGQHNQIPEENEKQNFLTRTTPKIQKRKSCLRNSQRFMSDEVEELSKTAPVKRKTSGFLNIRNIDGDYHKKQETESQEEIFNIMVETESDDDDNEHDIFGKRKEKQLIESNENLEEEPEKFKLKLSKKKSILKKDSIIDGSMVGWKLQKKKSVLFKTFD